jgi:hypothetical protein
MNEDTNTQPADAGRRLSEGLGAGDGAKRPTALLDWSLHVDCPKCGESNDLARAQHDCEHDIARRIFTNDWDKLEGWEVTCEHCEHEFTIERVEY